MISADLVSGRVLTFALAGDMLAIDASCVREILEVPPITAVPGASSFVSGLVNVRGVIVPLADLAVALGSSALDQGEDTRVIVIEALIEGEPTTIGILADKVNDVTDLEGMAIDVPPTVGIRWRSDLVRGIAHHQGQFIILPDLDLIFTENLSSAPAPILN